MANLFMAFGKCYSDCKGLVRYGYSGHKFILPGNSRKGRDEGWPKIKMLWEEADIAVIYCCLLC